MIEERNIDLAPHTQIEPVQKPRHFVGRLLARFNQAFDAIANDLAMNMQPTPEAQAYEDRERRYAERQDHLLSIISRNVERQRAGSVTPRTKNAS